jgi:hypothetical protein
MYFYFLSMEMIQIRTGIRGMWFPEKPSLEKIIHCWESNQGTHAPTRSVDLFGTHCATPHPLIVFVINAEIKKTTKIWLNTVVTGKLN